MITKRLPGRPQKFSVEQLNTIYNDLSEYIESNEDPTLAGFVSVYSIDGKFVNSEYLSDRKEFSELSKRSIKKQEAFLLRQYKNPAMAIFRLKQPQHGYTDKREVEQKSMNLDVKVDGEMATNFLKYLKDSTKRDT